MRRCTLYPPTRSSPFSFCAPDEFNFLVIFQIGTGHHNSVLSITARVVWSTPLHHRVIGPWRIRTTVMMHECSIQPGLSPQSRCHHRKTKHVKAYRPRRLDRRTSPNKPCPRTRGSELDVECTDVAAFKNVIYPKQVQQGLHEPRDVRHARHAHFRLQTRFEHPSASPRSTTLQSTAPYCGRYRWLAPATRRSHQISSSSHKSDQISLDDFVASIAQLSQRSSTRTQQRAGIPQPPGYHITAPLSFTLSKS